MAFFRADGFIGGQAINETSTTQLHPLGAIIRATDNATSSNLGSGEFIYLLGVASTVVGSLVTYSATTFQTTLSPTNATSDGYPLAVAMSANVASQYGWYQISGLAVIKKTAVSVSPATGLWLSGTAGRVYVTASAGKGIVGARSANLATVASATSTITALINRPSIESHT